MARVVVAGAGSSSGAAVLRALAEAGHDAVAITRDTVDLTDLAAVMSYAESLGPVDGLIHLVGGWRGGGGVSGQSDGDFDWLEGRVLTTLRNTTRAFFPALRDSGGTIAIVSTTGLDTPRAANANYQALKAAAEAWTRAIGHELAKHGGGPHVVRVMALYDDEALAADPDRDYSKWTHVDALAQQLISPWSPTDVAVG